MASETEILQDPVATLKHELKLWERGFFAAKGRKPGREDISTDASIRAKYREYDRLRRPPSLASKKVETPRKGRRQQHGKQSERGVLQERSVNEPVATPVKGGKSTTLLEAVQEDQDVEPTPSFIRCALGPTPQKDGQVLGIFDMDPIATPSKSAKAAPMTAQDPPIIASPSKRPDLAAFERTPSATPQSASKRRFLDAFTSTPVKRKREDDENRTPSTTRQQFATPAFLRRNCPLVTIEEEHGAGAPPFKRKRGFVRSLSTIIQGLRRQEEERMDDEWDIMNEVEAEECGDAPPLKKADPAHRVLVEGSQGVEMPLGPDQATEDSENEQRNDAGTAGDKAKKPWKKKGLKRQTRRVIMRPVLHKPQKAAELALRDGSDEDVVQETQLGVQHADDGEREDSDYENETSRPPHTDKHAGKKKGHKANEPKPSASTSKKTSATAHANYRALKIKNKNSKAGGRGRFGRGRR